MNADTYGAIKRDQKRIVDKYEELVSEVRFKMNAIVSKYAAVQICYETLKTILDEHACPVCEQNDGGHALECEMYEVMATLREIVEG